MWEPVLLSQLREASSNSYLSLREFTMATVSAGYVQPEGLAYWRESY